MVARGNPGGPPPACPCRSADVRPRRGCAARRRRRRRRRCRCFLAVAGRGGGIRARLPFRAGGAACNAPRT